MGCWLRITQSVEVFEKEFWNFQCSKLCDLLFTIFKKYHFFGNNFFSKILNWSLVGNSEFLWTDSKRYLLGLQIISLMFCNFGRKIVENCDNPEYHWNDGKTYSVAKVFFQKITNSSSVEKVDYLLTGSERYHSVLPTANALFHDFGRKCAQNRDSRAEMCPKSRFPGGSEL